MTLKRSVNANRAYAELQRQCSLCTLQDFGNTAHVVHEDGGSFFVPNAFTRVWVDPENGIPWVFLLAEHSEPMYWPADDLNGYGTYIKVPCDDYVLCEYCDGMGILPNRMDTPGGPTCSCGKPSRLQSGDRSKDCGPITCINCKGLGMKWKSSEERLDFFKDCDAAPNGWYCTREKGHKGPCEAW